MARHCFLPTTPSSAVSLALLVVSALLNQATSNTVYTDISNYLLTGWWKDFDGFQCKGDYQAAEDPKPLDGTGMTCYYNPIKAYQIMPGIFWFSKIPPINNASLVAEMGEGIYAYWVMLERFPNTTLVYPSPCDDAGVCDCGPFENVRKGWNDTSQTHPLDFCYQNNYEFEGGMVMDCQVVQPVFGDRDCNIFSTHNVTSGKDGMSGTFADLMASLDDTGHSNPVVNIAELYGTNDGVTATDAATEAPAGGAGTPAAPPGAGSSGGSSSWTGSAFALALALIGTLLL